MFTTEADKAKPALQAELIDGHQLKDFITMLSPGTASSTIFPVLHEERRWALDEENHLENVISDLQPRIREITAPLQLVDRDEFEQKMKDLEKDIDENQRKQISGATVSERNDAKLVLIQLTRQEGALGAAWEETKKYMADAASQESLSNRLDTARRNEVTVRDYLLGLDDVINSLLLTTDASNNFRKWITIAFAVLVGIVIVGFFVVASQQKNLRDAIFSTDSGLQFVTLFSLIIAIILFGVINVLEGRELSALLGGLSGYILGRGNFGGSGGQRVAQPGATSEGRQAP